MGGFAWHASSPEPSEGRTARLHRGETDMNRLALLGSAAAIAVALGAAAPSPPPPPVPSMQDILDTSPAADWRDIDPENTLYMQLPAGRVIIELAPTFAPNHTKNIRTLVREHFFDGSYIVRSQDNYVVQWAIRTIRT